MIKKIEVSGLPRQENPIKVRFHSDLNIVTGRNGSGKTTLLKLIWYIISGNIEHAVREVPFSRVLVETDRYTILIQRVSPHQCRIEMQSDGIKEIFEDGYDEETEEFTDAEQGANNAIKDIGSSVFFPTFRRIEGGFSLNNSSLPSAFPQTVRGRTDIEEALVSLSRRLTVEKHTFVSAISTSDIVSLLMRNYTEMSEVANNLQKSTSQNIINQIKSYKRDTNLEGKSTVSKADTVLDTIRQMIESMDSQRADIMLPLDAVRSVVEKLFQHSGIKLGARISFGDAATAVSSDMLSAGEKQMLSFICYNAFYKNSVIFIDEPELSLHVDWQRQLFAILQGQGTSNQFIIATHSPFIYSKYPDKEILIGSDRGESQAEVD
jgi:predicted ATPase